MKDFTRRTLIKGGTANLTLSGYPFDMAFPPRP